MHSAIQAHPDCLLGMCTCRLSVKMHMRYVFMTASPMAPAAPAAKAENKLVAESRAEGSTRLTHPVITVQQASRGHAVSPSRMADMMLMISICAGPCTSHSARSSACMSLKGAVGEPSGESQRCSAARAEGISLTGKLLLLPHAVDSVRNVLNEEVQEWPALLSDLLAAECATDAGRPLASSSREVPCCSCMDSRR